MLTFPTGVTQDTATVSQWLSALQSVTPQEYLAFLKDFRRRFPGMQVVPGVSGASAELGLGTRDEWTALVRAGKCFAAECTFAATAAQSNYGELLAPAGDTPRILVRGVWMTSLTGAAIFSVLLGTHGAAVSGFGSGPVNLLAGGAGSQAGNLTSGVSVGGPGGGGTRMISLDVPVNTPVFLGPPPGSSFLCELPANKALHMWNETLNSALKISLLWAEVPTSYQ